MDKEHNNNEYNSNLADKTEGYNDLYLLNNVVLQRWDNAINQISKNQSIELVQNSKSYRPKVIESVYLLYLLVRNGMKEEKHDISKFNKYFYNKDNFDNIMELFNLIDEWLYSKKITKIDVKKVYDRTIVEYNNKRKGM